MSEWLLGIVGIIALGLLLEIVLPDGQITKYVRGAFSLLVIVAVIAPLPKIFGGDFEFVFDGVSYEIDSTYLTSQGEEYESTLENNLEQILLKEGYKAEVKVVVKEGSVKDVEMISVKIFLSGITASEENTHISRVKSTLAKVTGVDEDKISVGVEDGSG